MIAIPILIVAGICLGNLIDSIEYGDGWDIFYYSIIFLLFFGFGIFCFKTGPRTYPAAKWEISSVVTTKNVDKYEGGHHFTHIEKDTIYLVSRK